jgi:hypothetical protein
MSAEVVSVKLKIGKKEIEVTPAEAKELYEALGKVVGEKKTEYVPYPRWEYVPQPFPSVTWTTFQNTSSTDIRLKYIDMMDRNNGF